MTVIDSVRELNDCGELAESVTRTLKLNAFPLVGDVDFFVQVFVVQPESAVVAPVTL